KLQSDALREAITGYQLMLRRRSATAILRVKSYETKQYKKGLKAADAILKKFPNHGEAISASISASFFYSFKFLNPSINHKNYPRHFLINKLSTIRASSLSSSAMAAQVKQLLLNAISLENSRRNTNRLLVWKFIHWISPRILAR
ncbi:uncharacterized protein LOC124917906, partial [Impatiens glandulifera]|uniref:uncharacterized protein LOC124917906 n=1 Tax=Impatiens glandulifera TaxID=253017 RepID=UPI001FB170B0